MINIEGIRASVAAAAGVRATVRVDGARVGVVLDATGLTAGERDALEVLVRAAADAPGVAEVRVAVTAERTTRRVDMLVRDDPGPALHPGSGLGERDLRSVDARPDRSSRAGRRA